MASRHYMTGLWTWDCRACGSRGEHDDPETAELDELTHPCGTPEGWKPHEIHLLRRYNVAT